MERVTGNRIGKCEADNLIAKIFPPTDSFLVELKTPGEYKRGTVLSLEEDGSYEVLGKGAGKANCVIAEDTMDGDETAVAYRSGHFNRQALICGEGHTLTAGEENDLRLAGIFLSDHVYTPGEGENGEEEGTIEAQSGGSKVEEEHYSEVQLNAMTITEIKALAESKGYTITKTGKADIIAEFLEQQGE